MSLIKQAKIRKCKQCGNTKLLVEFPVAERREDKTYYRHICKDCRAIYARKWREENKVYLQKSKRQYYSAHKDRIKLKVKKWQIKHRDYKIAYQRAWYLANVERLKEKRRKYYRENQTRILTLQLLQI